MASIDNLDVRNCAWYAMRVGELLASIASWKRTTGQNPQMADFDELSDHLQRMETKCLLSLDPKILSELEHAVLVNEGWEGAAAEARSALEEIIRPGRAFGLGKTFRSDELQRQYKQVGS